MPKPNRPQHNSNNEELNHLTHAYARTFNSPLGADVLEDLTDAYSGSAMAKGDPYATAYNVGTQDVLKYILNMIQLAKEGEHNAE